MRICPNKKCRAKGLAQNAHYCPQCGVQLPDTKAVRLVEYDQWVYLKKKAKAPNGKMLIEQNEYNRIVTSYNEMIKNGYVDPLSEKALISDDELQLLRIKSQELERWKQECKKRNTIIYDYEDKYTGSFYFGNILLGIFVLGIVAFWLFLIISQ